MSMISRQAGARSCDLRGHAQIAPRPDSVQREGVADLDVMSVVDRGEAGRPDVP
jgi:hypothetical protein